MRGWEVEVGKKNAFINHAITQPSHPYHLISLIYTHAHTHTHEAIREMGLGMGRLGSPVLLCGTVAILSPLI
jgi:hypothetical protein